MRRTAREEIPAHLGTGIEIDRLRRKPPSAHLLPVVGWVCSPQSCCGDDWVDAMKLDNSIATHVDRVGDDTVVLSVGGVIDLATATELQEAMHVAQASALRTLIVDLTEVSFMSSAGLAILAEAHALMKPWGEFAVVANNAVILRPLEITKLTDVFDVYPTLESAREAVRS
jgi:anti-sigma B factor antagonist